MSSKNKNRAYSITIGVLVFFIAVFSGLLFYTPKVEKAAEGEEIPYLTNFADTAEAVTVENKFGTYTIACEGPSVVPVDGKEYPVEKLESFLNTVFHIAPYREIQDSSIEKYGFLTPESRITYKLKDGKERVFLLGKTEETSGYPYFMEEGTSLVYLVDEKAAAVLTAPLTDLRNMRLFPVLNGEEIQRLKGIVMANNKKGTEISFIQSGNENGVVKFDMITPVENAVKWSNMETMVLDKLNGLTGDMILSDGGEFDKAGLLAPDYTLTLDFDGEEPITILIKEEAESNICYMGRKGSPTIYVITRSKASFLDRDYLEILKDVIYYRNVNEIAGLTVAFGEEAYSFSVSGMGSSLQVEIGGKAVFSSDFMNLYQKACSITAVDELPQAQDISQESGKTPELVLTFTLRDGSQDVISLYAAGDRRCTVYVNGTANFVTVQSYSMDLETMLKSILR